ncbi:MAG: hypothetical protein RIT27_808 [Pseudomonadota bacterium]|jgi:hypothetical protein
MKHKETLKKNSIEWQPLKMPIFLFLVGLMMAVSMVFASREQDIQSQHAFKRTEMQLNDLQKRNEESQKNLAIVKTAYPKYEQLKKFNFFDHEKMSLNWVSWLKTLQEEIKISELTYEFGTQQPLVLPIFDKKTNNGVDFFISEIKLTLQILHSEDLFHLIQGLKKYNTLPLFSLKSCEIKRKYPASFAWQQHLGKPLLETVCTLQWYSAKLKPLENNK